MRLNMKDEMEYARWRGTVQLSLGIGVRHPDGRSIHQFDC